MAELERAQIIARVAPALRVFGMLIENALPEACGHTAETGGAGREPGSAWEPPPWARSVRS